MEPTTSVYEGILKEYDQLQHTFSEKNGYGYENEIRSVLHGFGFDESFYTKDIQNLIWWSQNPACISENAFTKTVIF